MKINVNGHDIEGTPEEIAEYLKILENAVPEWNRQSITWNYGYRNPCCGCPNLGKGPCHCVLPYQTYTGTGVQPVATYSTISSATYKGSGDTTAKMESAL